MRNLHGNFKFITDDEETVTADKWASKTRALDTQKRLETTESMMEAAKEKNKEVLGQAMSPRAARKLAGSPKVISLVK